MANRGELTPLLSEKLQAFFGRPTSSLELRLIPYVQYVMINDRKIDPNKINQDERAILGRWRAAGFIEGGASGLAVTREFWDFMSDIMFDAYVAFDNPDWVPIATSPSASEVHATLQAEAAEQRSHDRSGGK